jgi:hypothetical protein
MDDFLQSMAKGIKERLSSTFLFNFILAWIVFNWEFVYITLFVNEITLKPDNKIDRLQDTNFVIWPAVIYAIGLTILSPFINSIFQVIKHLILKLKDWLLNIIDGNVPYTDKHYADLKTLYNKLEAKYNRAIRQSDTDKQNLLTIGIEKNNIERQFADIEIKYNNLNNEYGHIKESFEAEKKHFENTNILNNKIEIENSNLKTNIKELQNFGFYENVDEFLAYDLKYQLNPNENLIQVIQDQDLNILIGTSTIDFKNKKFEHKNNSFRIFKVFSSGYVISFLARSENTGPVQITVIKIDTQFDLLKIYETDIYKTTDYIVISKSPLNQKL